ncbi:glyoxalase superfamily protein [Rhodoferax sp. TBRC 17198]|uniref:glyoxalase superfamily protein n=1 Tax=Rhodoferax potami TaxID=3068338 RepID=UPI0028BDCB08|nr:glyoxalase superfamily protein [Rhodoferax sp. TBRC 17198]MDT7521068.1 glyoxalase superfamily protein [Rhodoferax sp. TBRC 17198]
MTASFTISQVEGFKREAKRLHRDTHISHSQALDQIASANGYSNWSLLAKHSDAHDAAKTKSARPPFQFVRTPELMRLALLKVPEPRGWGRPTRSDHAQQQVEDLSSAFTSAQNAVQFAIDYVSCLLAVPRFKLYSAAPAYWEMRSWLPYSCHWVEDGKHILVNRSYKPVGQVGKDWANYAEFPNLHTHFANDLHRSFTAQGSRDGYLFNDGCLPWHSRVDAAAYLDRLSVLSQVLSS